MSLYVLSKHSGAHCLLQGGYAMAIEGGEEKNTHAQGQVSNNGITCALNSGKDCSLVRGVVLCHKVSSTMK